MTELTDLMQEITNGTTAPQKRRGPKPGSKKTAAKVHIQEQAAPFTPQEVADAVATIMSLREDIRACAMAIVAKLPKAAPIS